MTASKVIRRLYDATIRQLQWEASSVKGEVEDLPAQQCQKRLLYSPYLQALSEFIARLYLYRDSPIGHMLEVEKLPMAPEWLRELTAAIEVIECMWHMRPLPDVFEQQCFPLTFHPGAPAKLRLRKARRMPTARRTPPSTEPPSPTSGAAAEAPNRSDLSPTTPDPASLMSPTRPASPIAVPDPPADLRSTDTPSPRRQRSILTALFGRAPSLGPSPLSPRSHQADENSSPFGPPPPTSPSISTAGGPFLFAAPAPTSPLSPGQPPHQDHLFGSASAARGSPSSPRGLSIWRDGPPAGSGEENGASTSQPGGGAREGGNHEEGPERRIGGRPFVFKVGGREKETEEEVKTKGWANAKWTLAMDVQLVLYACERASIRHKPVMQLLPEDLFDEADADTGAARSEGRAPSPVLTRLPSAVPQLKGALPRQSNWGRNRGLSSDDGPGITRRASAVTKLETALEDRPRDDVRARFAVLKALNRVLVPHLLFLNPRTVTDPASLAHKVAVTKGRLFPDAVQGLLSRGLEILVATAPPQDRLPDAPTVRIQRQRARAARSRPGLKDGTASVFGQLFSALHSHRLLTAVGSPGNQRCWTVVFEGEGGVDAGGLYRESIHDACIELQSDAVPLLIPTPNANNNVGLNREAWMPNPACNSPLHFRMYKFLGLLMGAGLRTGASLELDLPPFLWKQMASEQATATDLAGTDEHFVRMLEFYRTHEDADVWQEMVGQEDCALTWVVNTADGRIVDLVPHGREKVIQFHERDAYCRAALRYRLDEIAPQVAAMQEGFSRTAPGLLLSFLTRRQLEVLVCSRREIDIALLRRCTSYMNCDSSHPVVGWLWNVLEALDGEDRSKFLLFVSGRGRLPANGTAEFTVVLTSSRGDEHLPTSHTCFFQLDLPAYTREDILRTKLLYAIHSCREVDMDFVVRGELAPDDDNGFSLFA